MSPIQLRSGDVIKMKVRGERKDLVVISRVSDGGDSYNYFNLEDMASKPERANLETNRWERVSRPGTIHSEQIMMNLIPREEHGEPEVVKAKQVELEKLADWQTYELVKDEGQFRISTTWVIWLKRDEDKERN